MTNVGWLETPLAVATRRLRARADARAALRARRAAGRPPCGPRRRDERQVDDDTEGRGAPFGTRGLRGSARTSRRTSGRGRNAFRVGGTRQPIVDEALGAVRPAAERLEATQFEVLTAAAFLAFREARVEAAAIEAGLGGRRDATNVLDATRVVVLTNVSLEHTDVLGSTREAIAAEKLAVDPTGLRGRPRRAGVGAARARGRRCAGSRRRDRGLDGVGGRCGGCVPRATSRRQRGGPGRASPRPARAACRRNP